MEVVLGGLEDVDRLQVLEAEASHYPWKREILVSSLEAGYSLYLLQSPACLLGYAVISYWQGVAELLNFVVAKPVQNQGVGGQFILSLHQLPEWQTLKEIHLEVRASNSAAIRLYEVNGFLTVGVRKRYYPCNNGSRESALLMTWQREGCPH